MTLALKKLSSNKVWLLVTILAVGLLIPQFAFAFDLSEFLGDIIYWIVIKPFSKLLELELWILPMIAQYNNFTGQSGVGAGWRALRDLANMFFILVLLVIAFSTILRIQKYGYRQLLSRFLIMAILINFSMTIVGLVIDLSQIIMLTFVSAIKDVAAGNIMVALGLDNVMKAAENGAGTINVVAAMFLGAIMLIITVVIVGVYMMMLAMRIVKLWIEIVLAPIAFLAYTFPDTQRFYNEWVQELIKDIVVGPSLVFFLWLSFTITGSAEIGKKIIEKEPNNAIRGADIGADVSKAASPANLINFVIGIAMLMAGFQMSAKSGGVGASLAGKSASGIGAAPGRIGRRAGGLAKKGVARGHDFTASGLIKDGQARKGMGWANALSGGALQRAGIRADSRRIARRDASIVKKEEGVASKYGTAFKQSRVDAWYKPKSMTTSADLSLARDKAKHGKYKDIVEAREGLRILETGGDPEQGDRLKSRFGGLHTRESMQSQLDEHGPSALARMNMEGASDDVVDVVVQQDGKALSRVMDNMETKDQKAMMDAIGASIAANNSNGSINNGASNMGDTESSLFKASVLQAKFDGKDSGLQDRYKDLGDSNNPNVMTADQKGFADALVKAMTGKEMLKLEGNLFDAVSGKAKGTQVTEMKSEGTAAQVKIMVQNQVKQGNVQAMINDPVTKSGVDPNDIADFVRTEVAGGKTLEKIAEENMNIVEDVFAGQQAKFNDFARDHMNETDLIKLKKSTQDRLVSSGVLKTNMEDALKKRGAG